MTRPRLVCSSIGLIVAIAIAGTGVFAQQTPPRDARAAGPTGTSELAGTIVVDEPGAAPIPYAQIAVLGLDSGLIRITSSDGTGRFRLTGLPAGRYLVSGSKPPYVAAVYGARQTGRPGTAVAVGEGERRGEIVLKLARGAVIAGRVTDEDGQPAAGVGLTLQSTAGGSLQQQMMAMATVTGQVADDRGMYRFSGIAPGEYLVVVARTERLDPDARILTADDIDAALRSIKEPSGAPSPVSTGPPRETNTTVTLPPPARSGGMSGLPMMGMMMNMAPAGPGIGYAPVYYPGTVDATEATAVKVTTGEERDGVDIVARRIPTSRIEGVVVTPNGQPPTGTMIRLKPIGQSEIASFALMMLSAGAQVTPDGKFTMSSVPPGRYMLEARTYSIPGANPMMIAAAASGGFTPPKPLFFSTTEITIAPGQSLSGVELRMQAGVAVSGRVGFRGSTLEPPADASEVMVTLVPAASFDVLALASAGSARAAADGAFSIGGVIPGKYVVQATVSNPARMLQWTPQSVQLAGREIADLPIDVMPGEDVRDVAITLSDAQQELAGTLQDAAGRAAPEFTIMLFATNRAYWYANSRRVLISRPATNGSFAFKGPLGPPAGEYFLAAVTDLAPEDQYKPAFLADVAKAAIKVTVTPAGRVRQDIRIAGR